jgi:hypothetical protein
VVQDENLAIHASATIAINYLLQQLDKTHEVVRRLCGEVRLTGFEAFRDDYERRRREFVV